MDYRGLPIYSKSSIGPRHPFVLGTGSKNDRNLPNPSTRVALRPSPDANTHIIARRRPPRRLGPVLYLAPARYQVLHPPRGPAPFSFLLGNTPDLYSGSYGIAYHHALSASFGRAFKIPMFAGVPASLMLLALQQEQIYLPDTRTLTHVLVHDTHLSDTPAVTSQVPFPSIAAHELMDRAPAAISSTASAQASFLCVAARGFATSGPRKMIQSIFGAAHIRAFTPSFEGHRVPVVRPRPRQGPRRPSAVIDLWKWASRAVLEGVRTGALTSGKTSRDYLR
ncbi:hypothetical protein B0H19DRAFT_1084969 [Mycena capillaripes]|nr:hypothetical protein B0H19DRAFT_1084969 [Mycena capillaripes]